MGHDHPPSSGLFFISSTRNMLRLYMTTWSSGWLSVLPPPPARSPHEIPDTPLALLRNAKADHTNEEIGLARTIGQSTWGGADLNTCPAGQIIRLYPSRRTCWVRTRRECHISQQMKGPRLQYGFSQMMPPSRYLDLVCTQTERRVVR